MRPRHRVRRLPFLDTLVAAAAASLLAQPVPMGAAAPLLPCRPVSDANAPRGAYPGGGAAFVELQFYPPGFAPFVDAISCDNTHWCSALTIDSLECTGNGSGPCNNNCVEPVNFGFIQSDGV